MQLCIYNKNCINFFNNQNVKFKTINVPKSNSMFRENNKKFYLKKHLIPYTKYHKL